MFGRNKRKGEVCIDIKVNIEPVQYVRLLSQCRKEDKGISDIVGQALNEYFDKRGEEI